ncbi:hypothetical protein AMATHDRAFT_6241 [Amanita thiersii Skay4041]|uniref:DUF6534 domain-containing protein n=1 Tax=Amanita thiersii Skay4041 TaxID=703135 RepID=A0A2A9NJU6_9AGAR|nr:hypothetical protein AMATHDRAFT_6241 [Amanita thiersii Skay4041]
MGNPFPLLSGPIFIGALFNWGLLGTLILQVYLFSINFPNEDWWLKLLVYSIFILDILQTAFATHWAWVTLLNFWGDGTVYTKFIWTFGTISILAGIVSGAVQNFFAWTCEKANLEAEGHSHHHSHHLCPDYIGKRFLLLDWTTANRGNQVSLMQSLCVIVLGIKLYVGTEDFIIKVAQLNPIARTWLIGSAVCDILIAGTMIYILLDARRNSAFKQTETLITKLIIHTIETGAVTVVVASVEVALGIRFKDNHLHLVPAVLLGKMYSNVLLANLNGRARMQQNRLADNSVFIVGSYTSDTLQTREAPSTLHASTTILNSSGSRTSLKPRMDSV